MPIYNAPLQAVDVGETRRYAGLMKAPDFDQSLIDAACQEALLLAEPRGIYQSFAYDCRQQQVLSEPPFYIEGKSIGKHLSGCERVILLAVTVGQEIESQVSRYFQEGRYAYSVLLDAAATAAVEQIADQLERAVKPRAAAQGFAMGWRFSPGYGDWPLRQQPEVMGLSQAEEIGISLTESLMLSPRKSITAIIGLYRPELQGKDSPLPKGCQICPKKDCVSRQ